MKSKQINIPTIPRIPVHKSAVTVVDPFLLLMALSHGDTSSSCFPAAKSDRYLQLKAFLDFFKE